MTISTDGFMNLVLEKAISLGIAKTKNEALRMGLLSFNKEYGLVKDVEMELVAKKLEHEERKMKEKGEKFISAEEALKPYKHLLDKI